MQALENALYLRFKQLRHTMRLDVLGRTIELLPYTFRVAYVPRRSRAALVLSYDVACAPRLSRSRVKYVQPQWVRSHPMA